MSRIDDLIEQHAPGGVAYRPVGDIARVVPTARGIKRERYGDGGRFPIIDQGQSQIAGFTDDERSVLPAGEYVVFGDHTRAIKWVDYAFAPGADGTKVLQADISVMTRFMFYALENLDIPSRGYNRHWTILRELRVPVPPLEVQREIVAVLDVFTELEAELNAELEARRQQYAHYRDALLSFAERERVRWATLSELGTLYGGLTGKSKIDFTDGNAPFITYMNVFSALSTELATKALVKIGPNERQTAVAFGDVLFTASSESREEVGMASAVTVEPTRPTYLNSFCFGFRPNSTNELDPEFAKHLFRARVMRDQIVKTANGVTRINISKGPFRRMTVPLPEVEEQRRIADALDKFDALVNDLSSGLPAEIEARRRQYAYYRDRLLTFEEAVA